MTRAIAAMILIAVAVSACRSRPADVHSAIVAGALRDANVIVVTVDTLRADRVGAYGSPLGLTPTIDRFAREGVMFRTSYAHVPLTLPSHAAMMTGTYPVANGVHDNGSFRLGSDHQTLAAALKRAGYRTAAFVGAFVLDARFGLNAGFDIYDDRMLGTGGGLEVVQRPAEQVLSAASDWIATQTSPFFTWIHLYDPHEPYSPPEPYASRYSTDPYSGEIAYADASLGRFFDRARASNVLNRTLVVIASDHGESLGEHDERTHGLFAYDATLRVPLIFWAGGSLPAAVVNGTARLVDVMPTILDLVGADIPSSLDGSTLRTAMPGESGAAPERSSYFEALNANLTRNWAPLRGIVSGNLKLIDLPLPELYDLAADPGEAHNIYASARQRAQTLESALDRIVARSTAPSTPSTVDADTAARLRSLGYVVGTSPKSQRSYTADDDPKRLVHLNTALDDAAALWSRSNPDQAIATLRQVIAEREDLLPAYERLAFMFQATGRSHEAVQLLDKAARSGHADRSLLRSLGSALREAGDLRRSASVLEALTKQDESDLQTLDALGQTYTRLGRGRDAEAMFKRVLASSPNSAATWTNLGVMYLERRRDREAVDAFTRAVGIDPALAGAHNGLGVAYARLGDVTRAVEEWRRALVLRPDLRDARANLERVGAR